MESSRRDLLNDVAEHRSIPKNSEHAITPVLVSYLKQEAFPKMFCFYCVDYALSFKFIHTLWAPPPLKA